MFSRVLAASLAALAGLAAAAPTAGATDYFATTDNTRTSQDCLTEATACALGRAMEVVPAVPGSQQAVGVHTLTLLPGTYDPTDFDAGAPFSYGGRFDIDRGLTMQGKTGSPAPTIDVSTSPSNMPGIQMSSGGVLRHLRVLRNSAGLAVKAEGFDASFGNPGVVATLDRVAIEVSAPSSATNSAAVGLGDFSRVLNSLVVQRGGPAAPASAAISVAPVVAAGTPQIFGSTALADGTAVNVNGFGTGLSTVVQIKNSVLRGAVDLTASASTSPSSPLAVELSNSAWRNASPHTVTSGPVTVDAKTAPVSADPKLDGGGKPLEGSPLIDAGAALSELGALDLDGNARVQGPATDVGAYEVAPSAPPTTPGTPGQPSTPGPATPPTPVGPAQAADTAGPIATFTLGKTLKRSKLTAGKGITFPVKLNEPVKSAKVELLLVTKKNGKKPKEKVLASATLGPGGTDLSFRLRAKPSKLPKAKTRLTLRFTFVDAVGNATVIDKTVSV